MKKYFKYLNIDADLMKFAFKGQLYVTRVTLNFSASDRDKHPHPELYYHV